MEGLTVGRMVHYVSYGTPGGEYQSLQRAAVVTQVEDVEQGLVSLCVLNPMGMLFIVHCVYCDDTTMPGTWHWIERA